jgi:hypothetical protein
MLVLIFVVVDAPSVGAQTNCSSGATHYVAQTTPNGRRGLEHRINRGVVTQFYHPPSQYQILNFFASVQSNHPGWTGNIWQGQVGVVRGTIGAETTSGVNVYWENWDVNSSGNSHIAYSLVPSQSEFFNIWRTQFVSGPYRRWDGYLNNPGPTLIGSTWMDNNDPYDWVQATIEVDAWEPGDSRCPLFGNPGPGFGFNVSGGHDNSTRLHWSPDGASWTLWTSGVGAVVSLPYGRTVFHQWGAFRAYGGN